MSGIKKTDEPRWLDPRKGGVNLFSFPDIFPTTRLLFYLHAAHPNLVPLRDIEFHFGWDMPYARVVIKELKKYAYIEIVKYANKRIYFKGTNRYRLTKRGFDAIQDLLREATRSAIMESIPQ